MRVLHLSTSDIAGGAARSAMRLHEGLLALGVESNMLVARKTSAFAEVQSIRPARRRFWDFLERRIIARNRTDVSNTHFTFGEPGVDISSHPLVRAADVLHLHWITHFLSPGSLATLAALGKPIVWTLHDMRPLTGGCHFSAGCEEFTRDCAPCLQLRRDPHRTASRSLADQRAVVADISVVAPSRWLADCARRSSMFAGNRVEVIPYGINTAEFFPMPRAEAREQLGLPAECPLILFGADVASDRRKGAAELVAAVHRVPGSPKLMCFGKLKGRFAELGDRVIPLGYLRSASELRAAYSAANVFALPSLEDNLPNTLIEALACGTPVAAFDVGGIPDILADGVNGRLAAAGDTAALAAALAELLGAPGLANTLGTAGAKSVATHHTLRAQAEKYAALYPAVTPPQTPTVRRSQLRSVLPRLILQALTPS